jgi:hypothetical protein
MGNELMHKQAANALSNLPAHKLERFVPVIGEHLTKVLATNGPSMGLELYVYEGFTPAGHTGHAGHLGKVSFHTPVTPLLFTS